MQSFRFTLFITLAQIPGYFVAAWLVERTDPIPNLHGSPGIYSDAPVEVYFDNLKVVANQ